MPDQEEVPSDAPTPLGKPVEINAWVDADHAGDRLTRRSHTGILIFVQSAPIFWYSKRQATIESSTFGSEIVAMMGVDRRSFRNVQARDPRHNYRSTTENSGRIRRNEADL